GCPRPRSRAAAPRPATRPHAQAAAWPARSWRSRAACARPGSAPAPSVPRPPGRVVAGCPSSSWSSRDACLPLPDRLLDRAAAAGPGGEVVGPGQAGGQAAGDLVVDRVQGGRPLADARLALGRVAEQGGHLADLHVRL